ncbi:MAG TPA: hemerythrin domain-containing protein [Nitrospira sp.]
MRESKSRDDDTDFEMDDEASSPVDVFELLKADHRQVEDLLTKFEHADKRTRSTIADETLNGLEVHTALEEELVYPAIAEVVEDKEMVNEAKEEHHVAKLLIKELRKMDAGEDEFATKFKVLGEIVKHHIEEEEGEIFPQAEEGGLETDELSENVVKRKEKLMQKYTGGKKAGPRRKKAA